MTPPKTVWAPRAGDVPWFDQGLLAASAPCPCRPSASSYFCSPSSCLPLSLHFGNSEAPVLSHLELYSLMYVPFEIQGSTNLHVLLSESNPLTPMSPSLRGAGSHTHAWKI